MKLARTIRALFLVGVMAWVPQPALAVDRDMTTVTVANNAAETVVYTFTVPGGLLATSRGLRVILWGDYLQNSGANRTVTFNLRYGAAGTGGTLIATKVSDAMASQATTGNFWGEFFMYNTGTANSQSGSFCVIVDRAAVVVTVVGTAQTAVAVDSTAAQSFTITVQHSAAAGTITLTKLGAQAQLM